MINTRAARRASWPLIGNPATANWAEATRRASIRILGKTLGARCTAVEATGDPCQHSYVHLIGRIGSSATVATKVRTINSGHFAVRGGATNPWQIGRKNSGGESPGDESADDARRGFVQWPLKQGKGQPGYPRGAEVGWPGASQSQARGGLRPGP
jgi:hypothetical protein